MVITNCATGTLATYQPSAEKPWNRQRAQHLYRRLGFGANLTTVENALALDPAQLVDALIDEAVAAPLPPKPEWAEWTVDEYEDFNAQREEQLIEWVTQWVREMITTSAPREKLALFWSNHFVTRYDTYVCPSYLYEYHTILQRYALGNFKDFAFDIGESAAMLIFLNGVQNTRFQPNENYARELFELFTLGLNNGYTQDDIVEAARALTGYNGFTTLCAPITFRPEFHDPGPKTIFGQTDTFGHQELVDLIFGVRATESAQFICEKLYRHFVHPDPDAEIVAGLAQTFINNNFEIAPVLRQLFKSEHFFDEAVIGVQIKSPLELMVDIVRELGMPDTENFAQLSLIGSFNLGQQLFIPDDVAGWPGNRAWIDTNKLTGRWEACDSLWFYSFTQYPEELRTFAKDLTPDPADPAAVTESIIDFLFPKSQSDPAALQIATDIFKGQVPENYFTRGLWNLDWNEAPAQIALLLQHLSRQPEFQLR